MFDPHGVGSIPVCYSGDPRFHTDYPDWCFCATFSLVIMGECLNITSIWVRLLHSISFFNLLLPLVNFPLEMSVAANTSCKLQVAWKEVMEGRGFC
jgi:hypothetical protein